jgi:glycerophosphoryl diester phosphodiesterase
LVLNLGHRGASGHAPENTLAAFELAFELGADGVELDVQMTADGELVVIHDPTLDRTVLGLSGPVGSRTLAQVKSGDAGAWFGERFAGQQVPTLAEVFERCGPEVRYHVELKDPESYPGVERELLGLLEERGLRDSGQVFVQSFSPASLRRVRELDCSIALIQLYPCRWQDSLLDGVSEYASGIGPAKEHTDEGLVAAARERGLGVYPFTVNEPDDLERGVRLGVSGIFTDFPDRLRERCR